MHFKWVSSLIQQLCKLTGKNFYKITDDGIDRDRLNCRNQFQST